MAFQFWKWLMQPRLWRFVCFASTVIGLVSYALSSSFIHLFGHWNLFKILLYTLFSFMICFAILFAQLWHHWQHNSSSLTCKAHLSVVILTATTVYSFFYDRQVNKKPDAYSVISCASFAVMSLSLSRQTHFGFEVDLLYFFLGFLILQLMKIELLLGIVGVCFSYFLIILRSSLDAAHAHALLHIQNSSQSLPDSVINLKHVLVACSEAVERNDLIMTELLMGKLREMVSVSGEPLQRLGTYMLEGLVARLNATGSSIYKSLLLKCNEMSNALVSYTRIVYEICPYFEFGYMTANGAIAEAMKDKDRIHIIDFQISQGAQWTTLIQALADRPGGPPHIRITAVDDSIAAHVRDDGLHTVGKRLSKLAEDCKVPFEFRALDVIGSDVEINDLEIRPGEALAVNFVFMLRQVPDENVNETQNHRDRLLRLVKSLSPKVVTLVEQESSTNNEAFLPRFLETLDYYLAIFESIDVVLPRENKERINFEQHFLARDIVNIIGCEGAERVERSELLEKWRSRFEMAGFTPFPLNSLVTSSIRKMLENYSDKYRLEERDGTLCLGWMSRDLISSSAWK